VVYGGTVTNHLRVGVSFLLRPETANQLAVLTINTPRLHEILLSPKNSLTQKGLHIVDLITTVRCKSNSVKVKFWGTRQLWEEIEENNASES
jgi:hypothetical protein